MTRIVYPYLRPATSTVTASPWTMVHTDGEIPLPDKLEDWDYNLDLNLRQVVQVDLDAIRTQCRLPQEAPLDLCVVWRSSGSGLFGRATSVRLDRSGEHALDAVIAGSAAGGIVDVDTVVVLARAHDGGDPLAPHRAGSVLWQQRSTVQLQGNASQFPISVVDFSRTSLPDNAGWHLEINGSLDSAAMGSLLLLINEQHKPVAEAFGNAGKPRPADRLVLSAVYADVARAMIEHALAVDDFDDETEYEQETLGTMLRDIFRKIFGETTVKDVRLRAKDSPAIVATTVQAAVSIFGSDR